MESCKFLLVVVSLLTSNGCHGLSIGSSEPDELLKFFDGMEMMLTGKGYVDDGFHDDLVQCLQKTDPNLYQSVNSQWSGIKAYAARGGNAPNDVWYPCDQDQKPDQRYFEYNCLTQTYGSLPVWEPCNYASNIAYYHLTLELCNRESWSMPQTSVNNIIKIYASLAAGSSSMHASMTTDGIAEDRRVNDLMSYAVFYEALQALDTNSSVLHELSNNPRSKPAGQVVNDWMMMYIDDPVEAWGRKMNNSMSDVGSIGLSFCGFLTATFTVVFDNDQLVHDLSLELIKIFGNLDNFDSQELIDVCVNQFIPEFSEATKSWRPLPEAQRLEIGGNLAGTFAKLIYAFLWQEHTFTWPLLLDKVVNEVGSAALPEFNKQVTELLETYTFNPDFESGKRLYPGQETCSWDPHAKWHLQSAVALLDFIFLADDIHRLLALHQ